MTAFDDYICELADEVKAGRMTAEAARKALERFIAPPKTDGDTEQPEDPWLVPILPPKARQPFFCLSRADAHVLVEELAGDWLTLPARDVVRKMRLWLEETR